MKVGGGGKTFLPVKNWVGICDTQNWPSSHQYQCWVGQR